MNSCRTRWHPSLPLYMWIVGIWRVSSVSQLVCSWVSARCRQLPPTNDFAAALCLVLCGHSLIRDCLASLQYVACRIVVYRLRWIRHTEARLHLASFVRNKGILHEATWTQILTKFSTVLLDPSSFLTAYGKVPRLGTIYDRHRPLRVRKQNELIRQRTKVTDNIKNFGSNADLCWSRSRNNMPWVEQQDSRPREGRR